MQMISSSSQTYSTRWKTLCLYLTNNPKNWGYMSTGPRPSFSPSAHGYPLHHQHSSEHNLSQRPTTSYTLAAPSPVITAVWTTSTATSTMSNLSSLWTSSRLSLALKMHLYNSLIISIITYSSASWTLTKAQKKRLDAFNTKALHRILGVRWYDYVTNASILIRTGQPPLTTTIRKLRLSAFGHICRLQPGTQAIDILASTPPTSWRRPRGRPPLRWADQIIKYTQMSLSDAVIATQDRPSWRSLVRDATRPATQAT